MSAAAAKQVRQLAENIMALVKCLPGTLPMGEDNGPIAEKFRRAKEHYSWETFDRLINTLFGKNLRVNGRLENVRFRGPQGMQLVADYLHKSASQTWLEWEAALLLFDVNEPIIRRAKVGEERA